MRLEPPPQARLFHALLKAQDLPPVASQPCVVDQRHFCSATLSPTASPSFFACPAPISKTLEAGRTEEMTSVEKGSAS
jgi:hypothetical protein